jgi:hypothetical protein
LPRSFLIMIRPCQPIQASGLVGARRSGARQRRASGRSKKRVWPLATNCSSRWFPTHRGSLTGCGGMAKETTVEADEGATAIGEQIIVKTYIGSQAEGHDELPSGRRANGSSRLFPGVSELGTAAVATQSFHCRRSALLADCWHSCTHLHAYRDARGFVDRDLRVQGSTCRLKIRNAPNAL